jgi:hypothetical protein
LSSFIPAMIVGRDRPVADVTNVTPPQPHKTVFSVSYFRAAPNR